MKFQCYNSSCIETRGSLPLERRTIDKFCPHIVKANEAMSCKQFAPTETIDIQKVVTKISDEMLEKSLLNESSDGEVTVFKLPNGNIAVPILDIFSSRNSEDFVHVRDLKCSLDSCTKKTSKKHTLVEKGVPVCPHSMLGKINTLSLILNSPVIDETPQSCSGITETTPKNNSPFFI